MPESRVYAEAGEMLQHRQERGTIGPAERRRSAPPIPATPAGAGPSIDRAGRVPSRQLVGNDPTDAEASPRLPRSS